MIDAKEEAILGYSAASSGMLGYLLSQEFHLSIMLMFLTCVTGLFLTDEKYTIAGGIKTFIGAFLLGGICLVLLTMSELEEFKYMGYAAAFLAIFAPRFFHLAINKLLNRIGGK